MIRRTSGFTIVELLVVIVVIAILASITIISYNGIQARATSASIVSFLNKASKQLAMSYINNDRYPDTLSATPEGPITTPDDMIISYVPDNTAIPPTYTLSVTSKNIGYMASSSSAPSQLVAGKFSQEFFNNQTLSGAAVSSSEVTSVFYDWSLSSPSGVNVDNFSGRWSANIQAPSTGSYTFYVTSDDGQLLYINNSLVINDWIAHGPITRQYTTSLTAGQIISIRYEFFEIGGGAVAKLEWLPPSGTRVPIPAS